MTGRISISILDPRLLQIFILSSFLAFGWVYLDWYTSADIYLAAIAGSVLTQLFWARVKGLSINSLLSALISGLGLCLLLKVNAWYWMLAASIITISSKFLIQSDGKHIFNPTNFGIILLLILGLGWVSPGQWGSSLLIAVFLFFSAASILFGVKRWDVAITFLVTLFLLEFIRSYLYLGWPIDFVMHKFENGTLLLFSFFMITDPRTAPNHRRARVIWAMALALASFILSQFFYFYKAPIIALFAFSLLVPLFNKLLRAPQFNWISKTNTQYL